MAKLRREQKKEIYEKRRSGQTLSSLGSEYGVNKHIIEYLIRLIDRHGTEILRNDKKRYYSCECKLEAINRILIDNEGVVYVSIELGLSSAGMLRNWIKSYRANGYNVIEKKRGRQSMTKSKEVNLDELTPEEKLKKLEKRNQHLEAENEYLKKMNVVVKQRVEREKKKKQKQFLRYGQNIP